jgi:transposase InsO family protein
VRSVQDWDGWEQEDFAARYRAHTAELLDEFARYDVARANTPEERRDAAALLLEPAARQVLGRRRLAEFCLKGAQALATNEGPPETTRALAKRARDAGADPAPCLRAEALACNQLKRFDEALPLWVELITEHPPASHLASDYAEAAYTAFETHNPGQAMEILTTGVRRFGQDPDFALQAGWISLLTGNHGRAYQFLLAGLRAGYAAEVRENSLLLLSVAASLAGFPEDAATHYFALLEQDKAWADPATVDELDWPEELKHALRALVNGQGFGNDPDIMLPGDLPVLPDL